MIAEFVGVATISVLVGIIVGALVVKRCYKCEHQWENIIDEPIITSLGVERHTVVHMCQKCGKRKITKV